MLKFIKNISVVLVAFFVMFLSMGTYISKMECSKDLSIFLGKEVPNCKIEKKKSCYKDIQEMSCCKKKDTEDSCCLTIDGCQKDIRFLQFNFETIVANHQKITDTKEITLLNIENNKTSLLSLNNNFVFYHHTESPPLIVTNIFTQIQSFLL